MCDGDTASLSLGDSFYIKDSNLDDTTKVCDKNIPWYNLSPYLLPPVSHIPLFSGHPKLFVNSRGGNLLVRVVDLFLTQIYT